MKRDAADVGLVLVGGGAKGAYQVGALRYLCEAEIFPRSIAGTSIGALNGAVLASHRSFHEGVARLDALWLEVTEHEILQPNLGSIVEVVEEAPIPPLARAAERVGRFLDEQRLLDALAVFDIRPIKRLMHNAVDMSALRTGVPLWVTIFPALSFLRINSAVLPASHRANRTTGALWVRVQDLDSDEEIRNALMASAAIPFIFPVRRVAGGFFVDGGLGDNVPLGALAQDGCPGVVVIHLSDGSSWSRHAFPEQTIIEIRPEQAFNRSTAPLAGLESLLDFSRERVLELRERGYRDAKRCVDDVRRARAAMSRLRAARQAGMDLIEELRAERKNPL